MNKRGYAWTISMQRFISRQQVLVNSMYLDLDSILEEIVEL